MGWAFQRVIACSISGCKQTRRARHRRAHDVVCEAERHGRLKLQNAVKDPDDPKADAQDGAARGSLSPDLRNVEGVQSARERGAEETDDRAMPMIQ